MNPQKTASPAAVRSTRALRLASVALLLGSAAAGALAQYKIVGPDGKVTYTDKPPTAADIRLNNNGTPSAANGNAAGGLPVETRKAMGQYPVTLYAAKNCGPCDQARAALRQRGVPYNEYALSTEADMRALQSRFSTTTLPVVAIGTQVLKGYSSNDMQGYLDAAGYPAQAHLNGYRWPAAVALTQPAPETSTAANQPTEAPSAPASLLPPPSKSGIQF